MKYRMNTKQFEFSNSGLKLRFVDHKSSIHSYALQKRLHFNRIFVVFHPALLFNKNCVSTAKT